MKKPDTRYGGDPIYDEMSGFELINQPAADGTIYLVGDNREKLEDDVAMLNDIFFETFEGIADFPEHPMIYLGDHAIPYIDIADDATEDSIPRHPIKARYKNEGKNSAGFDPDEWIWEYVKSGPTKRGNMYERRTDDAEPSGYTCIATIRYLESGEVGWADYVIWRPPWLNYERFDISFRRRKDGIVVSKLEYRDSPDAQFTLLYKNSGRKKFIADQEKFSWKQQKRIEDDASSTDAGAQIKSFGSTLKSMFTGFLNRDK